MLLLISKGVYYTAALLSTPRLGKTRNIFDMLHIPLDF